MNNPSTNLDYFTRYCLGFYGTEGIYSEYNFTYNEIYDQALIYRNTIGPEEFVGDSLDRERVRDLVLKSRSYRLKEFEYESFNS